MHHLRLTAKLGPDSKAHIIGRPTRVQKTNRPPNGWPELWQAMPRKSREDAQERWKPLHADLFIARQALIDRRGEGAGLSSETASGSPIHALLAGQNV